MNSEQLGAIAFKINMDLLHQGLTDADISFVGMWLLSYSIAQTTARIIESKKDDIGGMVREP